MSNLYVMKSGGLTGEVCIGGAKNSLLVLLAASILTKEPVEIQNCPNISDVGNMIGILTKIGCRVQWEGKTILIDSSEADCWELSEQYSKKIRSSVFMLGSVLARFHKACVCHPGGCDIGTRPIDLHIKGLTHLNVRVCDCGGKIVCETGSLVGNHIHLDYPSVGATENIMMAATLAKGTTVIDNAAREPEVIDLGDMLNSMGAKVSGVGTDCVIIEGVESLHGTTYRCIPDRIAAGTFMIGAAITRGKLLLKNICLSHLEALSEVLRDMGAKIECGEDRVLVDCTAPLQAPRRVICTQPYPGFPTDMQPQLGALLATVEGKSWIRESVFDNRFKYIDELKKMGADIAVDGDAALFCGRESLVGSDVYANDLRGGAALVLAGLAAQGRTLVRNADVIDRGYENFTGILKSLGADIAFAGECSEENT